MITAARPSIRFSSTKKKRTKKIAIALSFIQIHTVVNCNDGTFSVVLSFKTGTATSIHPITSYKSTLVLLHPSFIEYVWEI